jgi:carboxylate-amine ligase
MGIIRFTSNEAPTIGIELELQLVDAETFPLTSAIETVLARMPASLRGQVKPELMQSYLEINTGVCRTVREAGDDLRSKLEDLERVTDPLGIRLFWAATHPFSSWRDQRITVDERYHRLVELMQDVSRQLVTFGLHVHVAVDSGDKAVMICDRMLRHLPLLLALSANSPFWDGRATGLRSARSKVMEALPTAGLPKQMRNWSEYVWIVNHLVDTGFIHTIRELWWDIRPHHEFGTVEIRVCDMPPDLDQVLALAALVQCLVVALSAEIDGGTYQSDYHPMMVQQNKWRAARYGAEARLVDTDDYRQHSVPDTTRKLVGLLRGTAQALDCAPELERVLDLPHRTGAAQQLEIHARTGDPRAVVREMLERNGWR